MPASHELQGAAAPTAYQSRLPEASVMDLENPESLCKEVHQQQILPAVASELITNRALNKLVLHASTLTSKHARLHAYFNLWNIFRKTDVSQGGTSVNFCTDFAAWLHSDTKVANCVAKEISAMLTTTAPRIWRDCAMLALTMLHCWSFNEGPVQPLGKNKVTQALIDHIVKHIDCKDSPMLALGLHVLEETISVARVNVFELSTIKPAELAMILARIGSEHAVRPAAVSARAFSILRYVCESMKNPNDVEPTAFVVHIFEVLKHPKPHYKVISSACYVLAYLVPEIPGIGKTCRSFLGGNESAGLVRLVGLIRGGPGVPLLPAKLREKILLLLGNLMFREAVSGDDSEEWKDWVAAVAGSGLLALSLVQLREMVSAKDDPRALEHLGLRHMSASKQLHREQQLHDLLDAATMIVENFLALKDLLQGLDPALKEELERAFNRSMVVMTALKQQLEEGVALGTHNPYDWAGLRAPPEPQLAITAGGDADKEQVALEEASGGPATGAGAQESGLDAALKPLDQEADVAVDIGGEEEVQVPPEKRQKLEEAGVAAPAAAVPSSAGRVSEAAAASGMAAVVVQEDVMDSSEAPPAFAVVSLVQMLKPIMDKLGASVGVRSDIIDGMMKMSAEQLNSLMQVLRSCQGNVDYVKSMLSFYKLMH